MTCRRATLGALLFLVALACARKPATPEAPTELEGLWIAHLEGDPGKEATLLVAGHRYSFQGPTRSSWYRGSFVLDTTARPKKLDVLLEECEGDERGKVVLAIYRLEGGSLRMAAARPGAGERPRSFAPSRGVATFELQKAEEPPPSTKP